MPFTLVHAGKYRTKDRLKTDTQQKLNTTQKKQTTQNTADEQNNVASYDTRPGNDVGLFYKAPEPTRGELFVFVLFCFVFFNYVSYFLFLLS